MESAAEKISLGKLKSNEKCFKGKSPKNRINKLKKKQQQTIERRIYEITKSRYIYSINNDNKTKWSPIRSVIIRVMNKIGRPRSGGTICQSQV